MHEINEKRENLVENVNIAYIIKILEVSEELI